jgi:hypothetical protein
LPVEVRRGLQFQVRTTDAGAIDLWRTVIARRLPTDHDSALWFGGGDRRPIWVHNLNGAFSEALVLSGLVITGLPITWLAAQFASQIVMAVVPGFAASAVIIIMSAPTLSGVGGSGDPVGAALSREVRAVQS